MRVSSRASQVRYHKQSRWQKPDFCIPFCAEPPLSRHVQMGDHGMKKRRKNTANPPHLPRGLEEQRNLLAQAAENSFNMIGMTNPEGHFTFVNRAFIEALGYKKKEELLGSHVRVIHSPRNRPGLLQEITTSAVMDGGWRGECVLTRLDGSDFPAFLSVGPIKDRDGRVIGSFGISEDITQRKMAEKALRESEEQFRQLAENIHEVFFVATADSKAILYISPAYEEIWGRPRRELYEKPTSWIDAVHPDDRARALEILALQRQNQSTSTEYRVIRPDGSVRWISNRTFPVHDAHGYPDRVVGIAEDITIRKQKEDALRQAHMELQIALQESEERAREALKVTELVDILQSCQTVEEAYRVTGSALPAILGSQAGALCITSASRNIVEVVAAWGARSATEKTFSPDSCWALRRGKIHRVNDSSSPLRCGHVRPFAGGYFCVPLMAHGETLGVLHLVLDSPDHMDALGRLGLAVGERISLALSNLRLREVLRSQSIRDPLTGLFNRRYMEESLERELSRAQRNGQPAALIMLDIDHFKQFNDTFGHQAGDALLRALGELIGERTRGQDVACRYGGEEFAIILSGASGEDAHRRAELLRDEVSHLSVKYAGQLLGKVTLSFGIAAYPADGAHSEALLRAADKALYRAKEEGRDRIIIA